MLNTDAEGRLVLADGSPAPARTQPDVIVDVATLTGAQIVALGSRTAGVMANDDAVRDQVVEAAERGRRGAWGMPLPEELRKGLDSAGRRHRQHPAASAGAACWRGHLPRGVRARRACRWAHLDIAGPAFNKGEPYGYTPKGGTGAATRTLIAATSARGRDVAARAGHGGRGSAATE